jgi:hypothetical protein
VKVAFDVKGTIEGPKKELVLKLFKAFQENGYECVVWSNWYRFAVDCIKDNKLENTTPETKRSKSDFRDYEIPLYDLAIEDDRSQTWLAASRIVFVDELTDEYVDKLILYTLKRLSDFPK